MSCPSKKQTNGIQFAFTEDQENKQILLESKDVAVFALKNSFIFRQLTDWLIK